MNAQIANQDAKNNQMALQQKQNYDVKSKLADLASTYGVNVGNLLTGTGNALGKNTLDFSQAQAKNVLGASGDVSQAQFGASNAIAGNQIGTYQSLGQSQYNTGISLATGRTNAGSAIAKNATDAAAGIGKLLESQGVNVSNEMANDIASTTKMISDYGLQDKISNENLAAMIANITAGQATNTQNAYGNIGAANAAGTMGVANAVQGGLTQGLMLGAFSPTNYNTPQYNQSFADMPFNKG